MQYISFIITYMYKQIYSIYIFDYLHILLLLNTYHHLVGDCIFDFHDPGAFS